MPRNFKLPASLAPLRDPQVAVRALLGGLVFLNLIAVYFVFFPLGGSPEELDRQLASLRTQIRQRRTDFDHASLIATKVEKGRVQGDEFMQQYFLSSRTAYSTILDELVAAANRAHMKPKEHSYQTEPIEGSDDLSMLSITHSYEGTYQELLRLVNEIDHSKRLIIIESLQAQPQQGSNLLNVSIKFDTFVKEEPGTGGGPATGVGQ